MSKLETKAGEVVGYLLHHDDTTWLPQHRFVMLDNAGAADVVYTRWRDAGGDFPFSPYNRVAHLQGLDFVGTDVMISPNALRKLAAARLRPGVGVTSALRELARAGCSFHAVDAVTYERNSDAG